MNKIRTSPKLLLAVLPAAITVCMQAVFAQSATYPVVDTQQRQCYNNNAPIAAPNPGQAFFGQDAQHAGLQPRYVTSSDSLTVFDTVTGLSWQRAADSNGDGLVTSTDKLTFTQASEFPNTLNAARFGGFFDWRLPTIKELYSLMDFRGTDPSGYTGSDTKQLTPFLDQAYFAFAYGDINAGERIIDAQYASSTLYTSTTMGGSETMFGVNFADGRIKGYPKSVGPGGRSMRYFVLCVRGNTNYGKNDFLVNGDSTITDRATGLMWSQGDCVRSLNWQEALSWVQEANGRSYLGHDDWRLPEVKELQSIVDYTRAPASTNSPAIDPLFACTPITNEAGQTDYPCYWTSTTHAAYNGSGAAAAYVAFGRGMGYMNGAWIDVHGAGCQRSDPKSGDPAQYPQGRGPQGDAIRIYNHVRLVRDPGTTGTGTALPDDGGVFLFQNSPNPFAGSTGIRFRLPALLPVEIRIFDALGREVAAPLLAEMPAGIHALQWNSDNLENGIYFCRLNAGPRSHVRKMQLLR